MKCKRILVTFLIVSLLAALSLCCTVFAGNTTEFLDGSGTQADPYLIADSAHLQNVKNYPSACFKLVKDLSVSNMGLTTFTGTFDGGGHTLSGLTKPFATTLSGTVKNLTLSGNVTGGLFAQTVSSAGEVIGCRSVGTVTGWRFDSKKDGTAAGGIASFNKGTITLCSNEAAVTATQYAGGICGNGEVGTVSRCYNIGVIKAEGTATLAGWAGGITGYQSTITDCFNIGFVIGDDYAGGLAGYTTGIWRSYNVGRVTGQNVGGITGKGRYVLTGVADVIDCYYLNELSHHLGYGMNSDNTAYRCSMEELALQDTYRTFDFEEVWQMDEGSFGLPVLQGNVLKGYSSSTQDFAGGSGVYYDPYLIETEAQLKAVKNYPQSHFLMIADITFSTSNRVNWTPLCSSGFSGVFDGGGHTISNLYYNLADSKSNGTNRAIGLFAKNNGVIRNLTLDKVSLYAQASGQSKKSILGGIAAESTAYGRFENCHVTSGTITAQTYYNPNWGGLVGYYASEATAGGICGVGEGTFVDCSNAATISTCGRAGGIAGAGDTFLRCTNSGVITVDARKYSDSYYGLTAGGIVGYATGELQKCTNSGSVSASNRLDTDIHDDLLPYAGGIFGWSLGTVTGCHNTGSVLVTTTWSKQTSYSPSPYGGGIGGRAADQVSRCMNKGSVNVKCGYGSSYSVRDGYTKAYAGGIVGWGTTVSDCVNRGTVDCSNSYHFNITNYYYQGGIAGYATKVSTSYNATEGDMLSMSALVGDLEDTYNFYRGSIAGQATVSNCYFLTQFTSLYSGGCSDAQLRQQETYAGFDFEKTWGFDPSSGYAYALPVDFLFRPIQNSAAEATADGISVTLEIDADAREYTFLLVGYRNGRMISCHMVTQPKNTRIEHIFTRLREGDTIQAFVLGDGFAPVIPATPIF